MRRFESVYGTTTCSGIIVILVNYKVIYIKNCAKFFVRKYSAWKFILKNTKTCYFLLAIFRGTTHTLKFLLNLFIKIFKKNAVF